jgi:hypothetical protein
LIAAIVYTLTRLTAELSRPAATAPQKYLTGTQEGRQA